MGFTAVALLTRRWSSVVLFFRRWLVVILKGSETLDFHYALKSSPTTWAPSRVKELLLELEAVGTLIIHTL